MNRNTQAIILESWPGDKYLIQEGSPSLSGNCIYYGSIYPLLTPDKTSYVVMYKKLIPVVSGPPKTEEIPLSVGPISPNPKSLVNLVHSLAKREALLIAKSKGLKIRSQTHI